MHRDEAVIAIGVVEAARRLGLSARTVATLISRHELPSRKVGRRRIIPVAALEAFIKNDHPIGSMEPGSKTYRRGSSGRTG
jgi:excisionase family DNA binding protein